MQAQQLMTPHPGTVRPDEPLSRAAELMERLDCGCIPVVDGRKHVVGVLTDRDVCLAALRSDQPLSSLSCRGSMSRPAHVCRADDTLAEANRLMVLHRVRRLPVVDAQGCLAGMLLLDDIAREARRTADLFVPTVGQVEVGNTLGEVARPARRVQGLDAPPLLQP